MAVPSHSPITTKRRLPLPLNGTLYTTSRPVAAEKPLPVLGASMAGELGAAYAGSVIVSVIEGPERNKGGLTISHAIIPSFEEQMASNWENTTCDIGGQQFDSVSRTFILLATSYVEGLPKAGDVMPTGSPFTASDYILENKQTVRSGFELEPVFRVERRNYVKRCVISEVNMDRTLNIGVRKTTNLYYRTENVSGNTIENLFADGSNAYWGLQSNGSFREGRQLSEDWFSVETTGSIDAALAAEVRSFPVRANLRDLPRELLSVNVVWNSSFAIGNQDYSFFHWARGESGSLGKSASDSASSSAAVVPEIQFVFRNIEGRNLFATGYALYLKNPVSQADVLARLAEITSKPVKAWPVFKPQSLTLSTTGQSLNVSSNVNISLEGSWDQDGIRSQGWDKGTSDDYRVSLSVGSVQIPPCIHGAIAITGDTVRVQGVSATAFMSMFNSIAGSISATKTKSGVAYGRVFPQAIAPVPGRTTIPNSGLWLIDLDVRDYELDHSSVFAVVFDAATIA